MQIRYVERSTLRLTRSSRIFSLEEPCTRFLYVASVLLLQMLTACAVPVSAEDASTPISGYAPEQELSTSSTSDVETQIRTLDRQVFLELVKLAEFIVQYQRTVNH